MIWYTPLCQQIVTDKRFTLEQRDTAVLWASELSSLCDRWVPGAPTLQLDRDPEDGSLTLSWFWKKSLRCFTVYVEPDLSVGLLMNDRGVSKMDTNPNHEQVKRAVQCFFEGFESRSPL